MLIEHKFSPGDKVELSYGQVVTVDSVTVGYSLVERPNGIYFETELKEAPKFRVGDTVVEKTYGRFGVVEQINNHQYKLTFAIMDDEWDMYSADELMTMEEAAKKARLNREWKTSMDDEEENK